MKWATVGVFIVKSSVWMKEEKQSSHHSVLSVCVNKNFIVGPHVIMRDLFHENRICSDINEDSSDCLTDLQTINAQLFTADHSSVSCISADEGGTNYIK